MPKDIMEMNSAELKQLRASRSDLSDAEKDALNERIIEVSVEEQVGKSLASYEDKRSARTLDEQATKRWPGLLDEESEFRKRVNKELEVRGDAKTNKRALLDASNAVAFELGLVPDNFTPAEATLDIMKIKGAGDQDAHGDGKDPADDSPYPMSEITKALQDEGYLATPKSEDKE